MASGGGGADRQNDHTMNDVQIYCAKCFTRDREKSVRGVIERREDGAVRVLQNTPQGLAVPPVGPNGRRRRTVRLWCPRCRDWVERRRSTLFDAADEARLKSQPVFVS